MTEDEIVSYLNNIEGFFEASHKTSFSVNRKLKADLFQEVIIDIFDAGTNVDPNNRYSCVARTEDGKTATGNPAQSIEEALLTVHWHNLD